MEMLQALFGLIGAEQELFAMLPNLAEPFEIRVHLPFRSFAGE